MNKEELQKKLYELRDEDDVQTLALFELADRFVKQNIRLNALEIELKRLKKQHQNLKRKLSKET